MRQADPKGFNWRLGLAALWLLLTFSLSAWWMVHGMQQASELAARYEGDEAASRQYRMFFWEGLSLLSFVSIGGVALTYFSYQSHRENKEVRKFFSVFTHELKTSLTSLRLQAEILEEDPRNKENENLRRLLRDVVRLELQLENALILAQGESAPLFRESLSLKKVLQALSVHWPHLTVRVEGEARLLADQRAVECIFRNLLQNASVHGGAKVVTISPATAGDGQLELTLRDDGKGFSGDAQSLGLVLVRHDTRSGAGVGLYLSRRLAQRMGGSLEFFGSPGFTARLRIAGGIA